MAAYIPFNQSFPSITNASLFAKLLMAAPKRKRTVEAAPKRRKRNYTPSKWVTFKTQPKENTTLTSQMETWLSATKSAMAILAMVAATPNPPLTVNSQRETYCVMC